MHCFRASPAVVISLLSSAVSVSCGVSSQRDPNVPAREATYSDDCQLQSYFDQRASASLAPPKASDELVATNEKGQTIGQGSYVLRDQHARRRFGRLLREEYKGVDHKMVRAVEDGDHEVTVHVFWWDAGQIRRIRPQTEVVLRTSSGSAKLPSNVCVSDLLFGDKVYAMRARFLRNEVDLATGKPMGAVESASAQTAPPLPVEPTTDSAR